MKTCPKCGATVKTHTDGLVLFDCWSYTQTEDINIRESSDCFRRQLAQRDSVISDAKDRIKELEDFYFEEVADSRVLTTELSKANARIKALVEAGDNEEQTLLRNSTAEERLKSAQRWTAAKGTQ